MGWDGDHMGGGWSLVSLVLVAGSSYLKQVLQVQVGRTCVVAVVHPVL